MSAIRTHRGIWTDRHGVAALDFALLLPLILLVLLGFFETYLFFRAASITERVAFSVSNMLAERRTLYDCRDATSSDYIGAYFRAADILASNIDPEREGVVIVSAIRSRNGTPYVAWQRRTPGRSLSVSSKVAGGTIALGDLPLHDDDDTVIVAEAFYPFDPFPRANAFNRMSGYYSGGTGSGSTPDDPGQNTDPDQQTGSLSPAITLYRHAFFRARYGLLGDLTTTGGCHALPK